MLFWRTIEFRTVGGADRRLTVEHTVTTHARGTIPQSYSLTVRVAHPTVVVTVSFTRGTAYSRFVMRMSAVQFWTWLRLTERFTVLADTGMTSTVPVTVLIVHGVIDLT